MKHALRVLLLLLKAADSGPSIYKSLKKNIRLPNYKIKLPYYNLNYQARDLVTKNKFC